jgi:hypothetical protein
MRAPAPAPMSASIRCVYEKRRLSLSNSYALPGTFLREPPFGLRPVLKRYTPVSDWKTSSESERIVHGLVTLARARRTDRLLVAGRAASDMLLELGRLGFINAFSTRTCGLPRGHYDVAMVAWGDRSVKTLKTTLDWLVQRLRPTGVVTIWIDNPEREAQRWLRLTLDQLGFRIDAGSQIEHGVAVAARRVEIVRAAMAA